MSAAAEVAVLVPPRSARGGSHRMAAVERDRPLVRLAAFAALGLYGVLRWATLLSPAPTWRLIGLLVLALVVAGAGTHVAVRGGLAVGLFGVIALLVAFVLSGVPASWVIQARIAVTAAGIGSGLSGLPRALLPYLGVNAWIRVVIVLAAAMLLIAAALLIAAGPRPSDMRRVAAASALVALAVVPMTLLRPELPYLQGTVLFFLLAAFMWADRVRQGDALTVVVLAALASAAAMVAAPAIDRHRPWLNYEAIAANLAPDHPETFDWRQRYGPLHWPRDGREILDVQAPKADYWKAENLDVFDGRGWVDQSLQTSDPQYSVAPSNVQRWTQTIHVTLRAIKTNDVIAAGVAAQPTHVFGTVAGFSDGTWADPPGLGPGDSYEVSTYDPQPTPSQLAAAGTDYPNVLLPAYLSLAVPVEVSAPPVNGRQPDVDQDVIFAPFGLQLALAYSPSTPSPAAALARSAYAPAYALARRLARRAATPYAYVMAVKRYLAGNGYVYDENPPPSRYPLETFLFSSRHGYCQQFAGAMALLLRMGGVPARVAAGFTPGNYNSTTRNFVVTDADAHAWVEAFFPRYGWVRFDPTPPLAPARGGHAPLPAIKGASGSSPSAPSSHGLSSSAQRSAARSNHRGGGIPIAALLAAAILVALLALALRLSLKVREPTAEALLAELELAFARCGRRLPDGTTLANLEHRLHGAPEAEAYVRALRLARFAGVSDVPSRSQRRALRGHLRAGLGVTGRLRALWALPPRLQPRLPVWDRRAGGIHST